MPSVLVAMSGGVDSSVAAALLKDKGYEVVGATMELVPDSEGPSPEEGGCCSLSSIEEAKRVAWQLDIPHYTLNFKEVFAETVINDFIQEYALARTPNPCIVCNKEIKFKAFLRKAQELGIDYIATGHYARVKQGDNQRYLLLKSRDKEKDQTYMLYGFTQEQLQHTLLPLGEFNKQETRKLAKEYGFRNYNKPDSQDICFVPDNDYTRFLDENSPELSKPGPIIDIEGNYLGEHRGLHYYTVGQRRGLGIAAGYPLYVLKLDQEQNAVIVGPAEGLYSSGLIAEDLNWVAIPCLEKPMEVRAKIRYNSPEKEAVIYPLENGQVKVEFKKKERAITPGQSVVFYEGDVVLGGGLIKKAIP